jgi:hypothetical protein
MLVESSAGSVQVASLAVDECIRPDLCTLKWTMLTPGTSILVLMLVGTWSASLIRFVISAEAATAAILLRSDSMAATVFKCSFLTNLQHG